MSSLQKEERLDLLRALITMGVHGRAEGEASDQFPKTFYPVREHLRMLDPSIVLIVGPRGSGKTAICRSLTEASPEVHDAITKHAEDYRLPPSNHVIWLKGFPLGTKGFDAGGIHRFLQNSGGREQGAMQELWFAYLIKVLKNHLDSEDSSPLQSLLDTPGGAVDKNHQAWRNAGDEPLLALDRLDEKLEKQEKYLFIAYDELDTIGGDDWKAMATAVQGLVAFWSAYARRWRHIRPKIFLRTDLFDRFATSGGADLAKLAAGRIELYWSDRQLYAMLLRRLANINETLSNYIRNTPKSKIEWQKDSTLGWLPKLQQWTDARPIIEHMLGPYMGSSVKKGLTFRWPLAHVRDGRGQAVPRPLVRMFETAAKIEINNPLQVRGMRILHPTSLPKALVQISSEHVSQALDEWPWMDGLKQRLKGLPVPSTRREVEKQLNAEEWANEKKAQNKLPFDNSRDLLDYLVEVGILRERPNARIDAPDLFLYGLELKRKGGVRRR